jgi:putative nucleotidyltransferase with HDIG domain
VLYLTALSLLRHAGTDSAPPANFRVLVSLAWVLEEALGRLVGLPPFDHGQSPLRPPQLLSRDWLAAPEAPARLRYLMEREDGRRALAPLAATRGVWQNPHHHLDVYDHVVLVLAYVEAILRDPAGALLDPGALDRRVGEDLRRQGIVLPPIPAPSADPPAPARPEVRALAGPVADFLAGVLGEEERLLLKWLAVLHDVGKPGTRCLRDGKVQFLGHELYGLQMLRGHLAHFYPEDGPRRRLELLIRHHHVPHQLVSYFADRPADLDVLARGLAAGRSAK